MKLLLDINVLLDVLLGREPWADAAARLLTAVEGGEASGFVAGHTITTIYYVVAQARDRRTAKRAVRDLLVIVDVVPVTAQDFDEALALSMTDFEDAVQAAAAIRIEADYIVTRNEKDFRSVDIAAADAATVLALL